MSRGQWPAGVARPEARDLYGLLTGRVEAIGGQIALDPNTNNCVPFGPRTASSMGV